MSLAVLPLSTPDQDFADYQALTFGSTAAPAAPGRFGFQVDVLPSPGLGQVVFGLWQARDDRSKRPTMGFGVRVDLERGEIWDIINGCGLIGWVETALGHEAGTEPQPVLFSLEIERLGSALLPKLQIGGEEWLYPAVRAEENVEFEAIAGCSALGQGSVDPEQTLLKASVWSDAQRA